MAPAAGLGGRHWWLTLCAPIEGCMMQCTGARNRGPRSLLPVEEGSNGERGQWSEQKKSQVYWEGASRTRRSQLYQHLHTTSELGERKRP